MISSGFVFLAPAFNCLGAGSYLYRLGRREISPNIVTWTLWWRDPRSESFLNFACLAVSALITLATIRTWSLSHYAFAAYLALLGISMTAVILLRNRRLAAGRQA